ncbi:PAS domain-containing protein, partial [Streptomyces sp. NPDC002920]
MNVSGSRDRKGPSPLGEIATALVDGEGIVLLWSHAAAYLLDRTAAVVCGRPIGWLLAQPSGRDHRAPHCRDEFPAAGRVVLKHHSGRPVEVSFHALLLEESTDLLLLAAPTRHVTDWEQGAALLRTLLAQDRMGVAIHDADLTVVRTNLTPDTFGGPAPPVGGRLHDVLSAVDADDAEAALRQVLETGVPVIEREQRVRSPNVPGRRWALSLSAFRLEDAMGRPTGVAAVFTDATERRPARRRLYLRQSATTRISRSLSVAR